MGRNGSDTIRNDTMRCDAMRNDLMGLLFAAWCRRSLLVFIPVRLRKFFAFCCFALFIVFFLQKKKRVQIFFSTIMCVFCSFFLFLLRLWYYSKYDLSKLYWCESDDDDDDDDSDSVDAFNRFYEINLVWWKALNIAITDSIR